MSQKSDEICNSWFSIEGSGIKFDTMANVSIFSSNFLTNWKLIKIMPFIIYNSFRSVTDGNVIVSWYGTQNFNFNCTLKKMDFFFCIMAKLSKNRRQLRAHSTVRVNKPIFLGLPTDYIN